MDSKVSSSESAISCIDCPDGYVLKKYPLKKWIYDNDHTQPYVAKKLGLTPDEFKRKLREKERFDREQIKTLIYLMGAEEAFGVIYFPTIRARKKVWREAFGKHKDKERLNEREQTEQP